MAQCDAVDRCVWYVQLLRPLRESINFSRNQRSIDECTGIRVQNATTHTAQSPYQLRLEDKFWQLGKPKIDNRLWMAMILDSIEQTRFNNISTSVNMKLCRRNITRDSQCVERCAPQCLDFILAHFRYVAILCLLLIHIHCWMGSIEPSIVAFNWKWCRRCFRFDVSTWKAKSLLHLLSGRLHLCYEIDKYKATRRHIVARKAISLSSSPPCLAGTRQ